MRRGLLVTLLVLVAAVGAGLYAARDPGYVLIGRGPWLVQTSLVVFAALLLVGFACGYFALRGALGLWSSPRSLRRLLAERRRRRAETTLERGLRALAEGRWESAEKLLARHAQYAEQALPGHLGAARAAAALGARERRDRHLAAAARAAPEAVLAVGLTRAELQIAAGEREAALATLTGLRGEPPGPAPVNRLLLGLYEELGDWHALLGLLPELRRQRVADGARLDAAERRAHAGVLQQAARLSDPEALEKCWERIPRQHREHPEVLEPYASLLIERGEGERAEALLRKALGRHWSRPLVRLYGLVPGAEPHRRLASAEGWLREHPRDPVLLLTLGRVCMRNRLWEKARGHLEASLELEARPETCAVLSELLERLDQRVAAADCARRGLALAVREAQGGAAAPEALPEAVPETALRGAS